MRSRQHTDSISALDRYTVSGLNGHLTNNIERLSPWTLSSKTQVYYFRQILIGRNIIIWFVGYLFCFYVAAYDKIRPSQVSIQLFGTVLVWFTCLPYDGCYQVIGLSQHKFEPDRSRRDGSSRANEWLWISTWLVYHWGQCHCYFRQGQVTEPTKHLIWCHQSSANFMQTVSRAEIN